MKAVKYLTYDSARRNCTRISNAQMASALDKLVGCSHAFAVDRGLDSQTNWEYEFDGFRVSAGPNALIVASRNLDMLQVGVEWFNLPWDRKKVYELGDRNSALSEISSLARIYSAYAKRRKKKSS